MSSPIKKIHRLWEFPNLPAYTQDLENINHYLNFYENLTKQQLTDIKDYFDQFFDNILSISETGTMYEQVNEFHVNGIIDNRKIEVTLKSCFTFNGYYFFSVNIYPILSEIGMCNNELLPDTKYLIKNKKSFLKIFQALTNKKNLRNLKEYFKETETYKKKFFENYTKFCKKVGKGTFILQCEETYEENEQ